MVTPVYITMRVPHEHHEPKIGRVYASLSDALSYFDISIESCLHVAMEQVPYHGRRRSWGDFGELWLYQDDEAKCDYYIVKRFMKNEKGNR